MEKSRVIDILKALEPFNHNIELHEAIKTAIGIIEATMPTEGGLCVEPSCDGKLRAFQGVNEIFKCNKCSELFIGLDDVAIITPEALKDLPTPK